MAPTTKPETIKRTTTTENGDEATMSDSNDTGGDVGGDAVTTSKTTQKGKNISKLLCRILNCLL